MTIESSHNTPVRSTDAIRSKLFVPGSRPELFDKAFRCAADALAFDLEDSVAPLRKDEARRAVVAALGSGPHQRPAVIMVRCNRVGSEFFEADLQAIVTSAVNIVSLPKIEGAEELRYASQRLAELESERALTTRIRLLATVETPRGIRRAAEIAAADARVMGLQLGFGDLFEPFGIERSEQMALNAVRLAVRLSAAEAGLPVYDGACADISNLESFRNEAQMARRLGYAGKSCIHPSQIAVANEVFQPSAAEVRRARRLISTADERLAQGTGAFVLEGTLIDKPAIDGARRVVAQAEEFARDS